MDCKPMRCRLRAQRILGSQVGLAHTDHDVVDRVAQGAFKHRLIARITDESAVHVIAQGLNAFFIDINGHDLATLLDEGAGQVGAKLSQSDDANLPFHRRAPQPTMTRSVG
jgi:TPP-dependent pyruvate/acetoin dehydrogenase alpha subunit